MDTNTTSLDSLADQLAKDYPYGNEGISLTSIIKLVLWVILQSRDVT
jgi:hypothetical protein